MGQKSKLSCTRTKWQGREAYLLKNDLVRLFTLVGGGHVAEFSFLESAGLPTMNPLWVPPWKGIDPDRYRQKTHGALYGTGPESKLLSGIVGHNICLDLFGVPSETEAKEGMTVHGEAPVSRWRKTKQRPTPKEATFTLQVKLPLAGLTFTRETKLRAGESVAYFEETVTNLRKTDHFFHWQQHVTLGPPFLAEGQCRVDISATQGLTSPHGYDEGKSRVKPGAGFRWPSAPTPEGSTVDLSFPLSQRDTGLIAGVLLDPRREVEFVTATNTEAGLMVGYCFRREDYPWIAIWEENMARSSPPWNNRTQTRGLEFGTTPLPVTRQEIFAMGSLFGARTFAVVPARSSKTIRYVAFLAQVPSGFGRVRDVQVAANEILILGTERKAQARLVAEGLVAIGLS